MKNDFLARGRKAANARIAETQKRQQQEISRANKQRQQEGKIRKVGLGVPGWTPSPASKWDPEQSRD